MNKALKWVLIGLGSYMACVAAIMHFYQDDPNQMHWEDREALNRKYISQLSPGDQVIKNTVIERLGSPDISEAKKVSDHGYQVLFYRTQHVTSDGITTRNECTPLLFKNDILIAWGESAYQTYQDL